ncbi:MAG: fructosamine kinase family protein [Anaerolineae bacterium]|nr:fructosamine kinase family protein [Anaerolineae bacterium]
MFNIQTQITLTSAQAKTILEAWLSRPVTCTEIVPLKGGMINTVLRLAFDQPPYRAVIKLNTPGASGPYALDKEAAILRYLRNHTHFPCPQVYAQDSTGNHLPFVYLLLECLPGDNLWRAIEAGLVKPPDLADLDRQLARLLLELHSHTHATFGKLDEPGVPRWADLFVPRLHEVRAQPEISQHLSQAVLADVDYAIARAADMLAAQGVPTLVHADIWAGNIIVQQNGAGWQITGIVDPGAEYADVELELAYLESFNNSRPAFMQVYTRQHPLRPGYQVRRMIYWLLTYLIHVWLFGAQQYLDMTAKLAAELRQKM